MELKRNLSKAVMRHALPFNRTSMELKHSNGVYTLNGSFETFNRTSMELKRDKRLR